MPGLRFALLLVLYLGCGVISDTPVWSYNSQQPPINIQSTQQQITVSSYNSEDYDGEQYEDNRLRLMLYPKKTITLNETNLSTWKPSPVTNPMWIGVTQPNEAVLPVLRSSFTEQETASQATTDTPKTTPEVSTSSPNDTSPEHVIAQRSPVFAAAISLSNGTTHVVTSDNEGVIAITGNISSVEENQESQNLSEVEFSSDDETKVIKIIKMGNTTESEAEIEYDDEQVDDVMEDSKVMKGENMTISDISSPFSEIIQESLLELFSNLTTANAMIERNGKRILNELSEQRTQIYNLNNKINHMYEILKELNQEKTDLE